MDYAALPPEINSARMYAGPGSTSMQTAATAWDALATELYSAASCYSSITAGLAGKWQGPAATAMAQAAAPYAAWLSTTAAQAELASAQARAAVSAHAGAFAATVPPPVIAANRAHLAALIATNLLGQNSPAIATTEANYEQMWAQDAAAMYGYAGACASATRLTPFTSPPPITDPVGLARQGVAATQSTGASAAAPSLEAVLAASQVITTLPGTLAGLATAPIMTSLNSAFTSLSTSLSKLSSLAVPLNFAMYALNFLDKGIGFTKAATGSLTAAATGAVKAVESGAQSLGSVSLGITGSGAALSAPMGRGMTVGALSVPHSWITAPATSAVAANLPSSLSSVGTLDSGTAGMPFMPLTGMAGRSANGPAASRFELRSTVVPRSPAAG
ncbi:MULTISPECIES: PPE family protein [Mycobacterium]|uniref:PPE family protein n=2 Tax=Mycobacterium ulcerans group TaxID=2993898 RepID=A0A9N7LS39_9MYCO|nr:MULTISPECIES: PPE family protein [Mycobacterium]EPQ48584.1 PPE family protein [Mycobacterium sp. 012931]BBA87443.1 PPE family protein [Mycobacterium pseudoshottsii JCM 15466]BDN81613.1 PPE family protein [Mycobacterium pseudoshottsii]